MRPWQTVVLILLLIGTRVYIAYNPLFSASGRDAMYAHMYDEQEKNDVRANIVTFCSDPWVPYAGYEDAEQPGYIIDVLRAIYEPLGHEVRFVNLPWSRCLRDTRNGVVSGLAGADFHEAPDFIFPKEAIGVTWPTFFTSVDSEWTYSGPESLKDAVIGIIQDYTYSRDFDDYVRRAHKTERVYTVTGQDALAQLIAAVRDGKITAFVENMPVVYQTLKELGADSDSLRNAGSAGPGAILFVPFSPRVPASFQYADQFDEGIERIRESGELDAILSVYGVSDWHHEVDRLKSLTPSGDSQ
jgi:polar amino acid transport system substrate-binding protein